MIPHPLLSGAMARPDALAVVHGTQQLTYAALCRKVRQLAHVLASQVHPGERVALWGAPGIDWLVAWHALSWLGAAVLPLPPRATAAELQAALRAASVARVLSCDLHAVEPPLQACDMLHARPPADSAPEAAERLWPLDEVRAVLMTSGSTAAPKPVCLTVQQLVFAAMGSAMRLGHLPSDRWLACLPQHHVGGLSMVLRAAWGGTTLELQTPWHAATAAQALDSGRIHLVSLVPAMLQQVLDARAAQPFPAALRAVLLGGAPASAELLQRARELGVPVCVTWGMTETAAQVCTTFPNAWEGEGHVGPALPFCRVHSEADGALRVEGATVLAPLRTGDRGQVDARGHVHVQGRLDDVMISGGENIVPEEIEAVLRAHPAVQDVAVVAQTDAQWGQRPVAVLVARDAAPVDDATLRAWCAERLTRFKIPVRFVWCARLPRNALGKLHRRTLLAQVT